MLLFFLFATFYTQRNKKPFLVASILVALANTNVHSCIFVCVIATFWFIDVIIREHHFLNFRMTTVFLCAFAFIGIGIAFAMVTCLPTQDTIVTKAFSLETQQVLKAFCMNIMHPGMHYYSLFYGLPAQMRDVLLWVLIVAFLSVHLLLLHFLWYGFVREFFFNWIWRWIATSRTLVNIYDFSLLDCLSGNTIILPINWT